MMLRVSGASYPMSKQVATNWLLIFLTFINIVLFLYTIRQPIDLQWDPETWSFHGLFGDVPVTQDLRPPNRTAYAVRPQQQSHFDESLGRLPSCHPEDDLTNPRTIEYGREAVRLSVAHEGSGNRIRAFMNKLANGEPVKIGVIGGSVTWGHGLNLFKEGVREFGWHYRVMDWIKKQYPNSDPQMFDGAVAGVVVQYFSVCFQQHIPDNVDIVFVELDINSLRDDETFRAYDSLYRSLLSLPNKPAVVSVSLFALVFPEIVQGFSSMLPVAQYNDIPVVTLRNWLLPHILLHPLDKDLVFHHEGIVDLRHINKNGHQALADFLILFLQKQACEAKIRQDSKVRGLIEQPGTAWPNINVREFGGTPKLRITDPFPSAPDLAEIPTSMITQPQCRSLSSRADHLSPVSKLFTTPAEGWSNQRINDKPFFVTTKPWSRISFKVHVPPREVGVVGGQLGLFIWMTPVTGDGGMGKVACWVPGVHDEPSEYWTEQQFSLSWDGVVYSGYRDFGVNVVEWTHILRFKTPVPEGQHTLTCMLLPWTQSGGVEFRIQGLTVY